MGEVYLARGTNLGRDVALKTLPAAFSIHAEPVARFRRGAQSLAALNHAHIAQINSAGLFSGTAVAPRPGLDIRVHVEF